MTDIVSSGDNVLFMKIGTHANEELADIIERKKREISDAGFAMWGYGGNTCHPRTMVQPFARRSAGASKPILLCMQPMDSRHFADPIRADEYSVDGAHWDPVPERINVWGSRYALCIRDLHEVDGSLALSRARVALGTSKGRAGDEYISGHVDKACFEIVDAGDPTSEVQIGFVAEIVEPYAVFLRN